MAQSNFVDNVRDRTECVLQHGIIPNLDIIADMAASPHFARSHLSSSEIDMGAHYTIKFEDERKTLCKNWVKCEQSTRPERIIPDIVQFRGDLRTTSIGQTISENYGIHMNSGKSFQFYKRVPHESNSGEDS